MIKFEDLKINNLFLDSAENTVVIDFNGVEVTVKRRLGINDIMLMTSYILSEAEDPNKSYFHPIRFKALFENAILEFYTDIEIPEDMTIATLYDLVTHSGLMEKIKIEIKDDLDLLYKLIEKTSREIYAYKSSAVGIMERIAENYSNISFDTEQIKENLNNPEALELLRNIMDRFG